jgi:hypothetical protein
MSNGFGIGPRGDRIENREIRTREGGAMMRRDRPLPFIVIRRIPVQ